MIKKRVIALCVVTALLLTACGGQKTDKKGNDEAKNDDTKVKKVGIVLSTGGLGDKNFNDMAYGGLLKAQEDLKIEFDYVEPKSVSDFLPNFRMFAESEEYDLIIGMASDQNEAIVEVAADFPDQKFSIVDSSVEGENISSIFTKWQEQTFLTGVLAGLGTKSKMELANEENIVGVILGKEIPTLREGVVGFKAGVKYVNPDAEILEAVVGEFNDPGKGKEIALSMYSRGADFIQHIAGASGLGLFNAAKESKRYAFGVGGNQNANDPDYIAATALRNVNEMVYNEVKAMVDGTWEPGIHVSGIKEGSVGIDLTESNVVLTPEIEKALEEIKQSIADGTLVPCNTEEELSEWVSNNQYK